MIEVMLPWPPKELSPNARLHWAAKSKAKRAYREACAYQAMSQGAKAMDADRLRVSLQFVPPDRRARDWDNCLASVKSGLDGLADVLKVDDSRWEIAFTVDREQIGGFVRARIE